MVNFNSQILKIILLKAAAFVVVGAGVFVLFGNFVVSGSEIFYMSVPFCWVLFNLLFAQKRLFEIFEKQNLLNILTHSLVLVCVFWYLSFLMYGRILWREVMLAGYFLVSVGIVVSCLQYIIKLIAKQGAVFIENVYLKKTVYCVIVVVLWSFTIFPYILSAFSTHRPKIGDRLDPRTGLMLEYDDISFVTRDNVLLRGWFVENKDGDKSVVIGHGLGANKSNFMSLVSLWYGMGYNVLIFDFRGHGHSEGHTVSFGYKERYDIIAAVDYLCSRPEVDSNKIWGYGVSFGGAALIHAAAEDKRIKGVVVDSAFADIETMAEQVVSRMGFVPPFVRAIIARLGLNILSWELGFNVYDHLPKNAVTKFDNQPILIIHGKNDVLIPYQESLALYENATQPKQFYSVNSAGHYTTLSDRDYVKVIKNFISINSN